MYVWVWWISMWIWGTFLKKSLRTARIQGGDASIWPLVSLSTEPGGSLGVGAPWDLAESIPSLGVRMSSILPEFWPCCPLSQGLVLLTLGCSSLSLLGLCCLCWQESVNPGRWRIWLHHQLCPWASYSPSRVTLHFQNPFNKSSA